MNKCDIGSDKETPLQRQHGRWDNTPIVEFGEKILYIPAKPARGKTWEPRFHPRVSLEMLNSSSEAVVVTEQGTAIKTRSARTEYSEHELFHVLQVAVTMHSTFKREGGETHKDGVPGPGIGADGEKVARTYFRRVPSCPK